MIDNIAGNKNLAGKGHQLHNYEVFRDVYFSINDGEPTRRFSVSTISEMFNGVYTPNEREAAFNLEFTEEMKKEGYFYVPPRLISGDIIAKLDFNLIDEFEITILAHFMEVTNLSIVGENGDLKDISFQDKTLKYYPLMDTILLGNLYVKARLGYVHNPEHSISLEGICIGMTPRFRKDGIPMVTFKFRDVAWEMTKVNLKASYPNLGKNSDLSNAASNKDILNPEKN